MEVTIDHDRELHIEISLDLLNLFANETDSWSIKSRIPQQKAQ